MDLCAEMLARGLPEVDPDLRVTRLGPLFRRRFGRLPFVGPRRAAVNADRFLNRFLDYPSFLRSRRGEFDLFHSYAHLAWELPADRVGVYCHDLDAFRCLLEPSLERRPPWFRAMARRILRGFARASVEFYSTESVGHSLQRLALAAPREWVYAPYGIAPEFSAEGADSATNAPPGADLSDRPFVLHVGSCIPRKRIDVLLDVFA
jgi:hypothetical protein